MELKNKLNEFGLRLQKFFGRPRVSQSVIVFGILLIVASFVFRFSVLEHPGYAFDLKLNKEWSLGLAQHGLSAVKDLRESPINYFPNYALTLFLWKGIGSVFLHLHLPDTQVTQSFFTALIKLPGIFGDILVVSVLFAWGFSSFRGARRMLPAVLYALAPGIIYDSAIWGQVDSLHTGCALAGLFAWSRGKKTLAGMLFVTAVFFKVHAIIFLVLYLVIMLSEEGVRVFLKKRALAMFATAALITLPYYLVLGVRLLAAGSVGSFEKYPFITLNAMNIWWPATRIAGSFIRDDQGAIPLLFVGFALFVLVSAEIFYSLAKKVNETRALQAAALIAFAFFLFPTEMHERYLFPFFAFAVLCAARSKRWFIATIVLSVSFFINLVSAAPVIPRDWLYWHIGPILPLIDGWWLVNIVLFFFLLQDFRKHQSN